MNKKILVFGVLMFSFVLTFAQDKLNNAFRFSNGIYKTFEDFKSNKPSTNWKDVTSDLIVMESVHKAKMGNLLFSSDSSVLNIGNIWGFCVNGIPYKRVLDEEGDGFFLFSGLQLRGKICYYEYEVTKEYPVEISAYNPLTNKPYLTSTVMREKKVLNRIMLDFNTGNSDIFTLESVEKWIATDTQLLTTFVEMDIEERKEKLLKFLQIFNDRNIIKINN